MTDDKFKYLGLTPIKREGGVYSDEPEFQVLIEENYRLNAEIKKLREALKPLSEISDNHSDKRDDYPLYVRLLVGELRAARTALGETDKRMGETE